MTDMRLKLPKKMAPFMQPSRWKGAKGGRGSGKSWTVARILLTMGMERKLRVLCAREVQKSIKDSVHKLLSDQIDAMKLGGVYDVQRDVIKGPFGTEFLFAGLQDHTVDSIKSYEAIDICWVEEAHTVSERSWEILTPTIRAPGSEIWATWNPESKDDPVEERFVKNPIAGTVCVEMNYRDNPWFPEVLADERDKMRAMNYDLYLHIWEGHYRTDAGIMFKRNWFKWYDRAPADLAIYMSADYAVTEDGGDFTEIGVWGLSEDGDLFALDWWTGQTDPDVWIEAGIRLTKLHNPAMWYEEKGVILRAVDSAINRKMRTHGKFTYRMGLPSASNKAARAMGFQARASAGAVHFPSDKPWAAAVVEQLCAFNGEPGRVDDKVDVCSLIGRALDQMNDPMIEQPEKRKIIKPMTIEWLEHADQMATMDEQERRSYYR